MRLAVVMVMGMVCAASGISARGADVMPFRVGEKLHYKVFWGVLEVGTATLEVEELSEIDGRPAYRIVGTITSNSFISKVYPVHSMIETYLDAEGLYSRRFTEDRHEGKYVRERRMSFDYKAGEAKIEVKNRTNIRTVALKEPVQDGFSSIYYLRTQPLQPDSVSKFLAIGTSQTVEISIAAHETKNLRMGQLGTFPAIRVEPSSNYESIFSHKGGMTVWVSADERRIPLLMTTKIIVGSVSAELDGIEVGTAAPTASRTVPPTSWPECPLAAAAEKRGGAQ